ncbi:COPII coat assembly protein SEC16 [Coccidioides immitis RS]|uniref:COPII coat assembly protein SEC16 n=1 Tax=Coccidioides immitis (strain RS) TaxID=246410 RepID=SEC16_COCIM|nr:COPII coat assembly protein SEC16 [Coccidioides immitis RS]Q1DHP3.1 RecName: Full=COPII coat assembly protein SEC16; AltName: Full=Protein transport protein SEC16 [Coccidioides immitis RS]EAS27565.3 COPII coat assembly protein SEC16 [Coccidioides immitis RS]
MAEDRVLGHESGLFTDAIHLGAWNPAHRPEDFSDSVLHEVATQTSVPIQTPDLAPCPPTEFELEHRDPEASPPDNVLDETKDVEYLQAFPEAPTRLENSGHVDITGSEYMQSIEKTREGAVIDSNNGSPFIDSFKGSDDDTGTNTFPDDNIDFQAMIGQTHDDTRDVWDRSTDAHVEDLSTQLVTEPYSAENDKVNSWNSVFADDEGGGDFFSQISSQSKPTVAHLESEPRSDDMASHLSNGNVQPSNESQQTKAIDSLFQEDESTGEADFFNSQGPAHVEPSLELLSETQPNSMPEDHPLPSLDPGKELPHHQSVAVVQDEKPEVIRPAEPGVAENLGEEELAERWKAFLGDDDILIENETLDGSIEGANTHTAEYQRHPVQPASQVGSEQPPVNTYTPHQPSSSEMLGGLPAAGYSSTLGNLTNPEKSKVESFSNQSKAGYQSPYDLPFDMRPKHAPPRKIAPPVGVNPPPRSSSMSGSRPPSSSYMVPGPNFSPVAAPPPVSGPDTTPPSTKEPVRTGSFFEELPVVSRSRPSTRGRYTPQPNMSQPASNLPMAPVAPPPSLPQQSSDPYSQFQLQPPARLDPYSNLSAPPPQPAPTTSRYSPQPPPPGTKPAPFPRYSPAPPQSACMTSSATYVSQSPTVQSSVNALPFQPRTSSPLAQHETAKSYPSPPRKRGSLPVTSIIPTSSVPQFGSDSQIVPPKRSMTQSPGRMMPLQSSVASNQNAYVRPASAHGSKSSIQAPLLQSAYAPAANNRPTQALDFVVPTDGQEHDPLERWKGAPIFKFGFGGTLLSTFPKHIPRYATGQMTPRIKPTLGDIKTCPISQILPHNEPLDKFPGPLKSKSKKKDVLTWLSTMISALEGAPSTTDGHVDPVHQHRREDGILLWKVVRVLVEHDGALRGSTAAEASLQSIFSPGSMAMNSQFEYPSTGDSVSGSLKSESASSLGIDVIHKSLVAGDRQKAVWDAVDHRLWGHAMLISSTLDKSVWKQVTQEFIRREVRSLGKNTESLAALYEIFAGNFEESIDELVPPSARAGLQMVSVHAGTGAPKDALEGLNKWRDTVNLILQNKIAQDHQALRALGRLLASYGRVEASHICSLVAGTAAGPIFGDARDPQASIVLLGADHWRNPTTFMVEREACLLTEVYEFATSVLAASPSPSLAHLQAFKLRHAMYLAEEGHKSEAQQYCEAIVSIVTSKSNVKSPYYHQRFFAELDELSHRLRQAPTDGSSSWISKPSMEKVSGSMWAKFNSFVSGDDNEVTSNGSGKGGDGDIGPFAKIAGTPPISRSPSVAEGHGSYFPSQPVAPSSSGSRYAPNSQYYAPYSSPEQSRGRRSLDAQRSPPQTAGRSYSQRRNSQDPSTPLEGNAYGSMPNHIYASPATIGSHITPPQASHAPLAPVEEIYSPQIQSPTSEMPAIQTLPDGFGINQTGYMPLAEQVTRDDETNLKTTTTEQSGYQPPTYEPPSFSTGYEPPSYSANVEDNEHSDEEKPKKKSFMDDDDDDFMARAAQLRASEKEKMDREAAEAFRKAAEADAKRPLATEKKGWFSGWFGKKESGGAVRADLGDENSFYFDKELNRWVNKKDPGSAATAAVTPPPPKSSAPSSQSVSTSQTPTTPNLTNGRPGPSAVPGGTLSAPPPGIAPLPTPPSSSLGPPSDSPRAIPRSVSAGAPTGPPSRPGTSLSNASSIDDLLGAPQARKGGTMKTRRKGRGYVDVMAK